jgi:hypothetical protein
MIRAGSGNMLATWPWEGTYRPNPYTDQTAYTIISGFNITLETNDVKHHKGIIRLFFSVIKREASRSSQRPNGTASWTPFLNGRNDRNRKNMKGIVWASTRFITSSFLVYCMDRMLPFIQHFCSQTY